MLIANPSSVLSATSKTTLQGVFFGVGGLLKTATTIPQAAPDVMGTGISMAGGKGGTTAGFNGLPGGNISISGGPGETASGFGGAGGSVTIAGGAGAASPFGPSFAGSVGDITMGPARVINLLGRGSEQRVSVDGSGPGVIDILSTLRIQPAGAATGNILEVLSSTNTTGKSLRVAGKTFTDTFWVNGSGNDPTAVIKRQNEGTGDTFNIRTGTDVLAFRIDADGKVAAPSDISVALVVRGEPSQSANIVEVHNSAAGVLASVSPAAKLTVSVPSGGVPQLFFDHDQLSGSPSIRWRSEAGLAGLRLYTVSAGNVATEVARFQDNGALVAGTFNTTGGVVMGDFFVQRAAAGRLQWGAPGEPAVTVKNSDGTNSYTSVLTVEANKIETPVLLVKGMASQSADLQQWQNSIGTPGARVNYALNFTRPHETYTSYTEQFGAGSIVGANNSVALGVNCTTTGAGSQIAVGLGCRANSNSVIVGFGANSGTGSACFILGNYDNSVNNYDQVIAIGINASSTGIASISIGAGAVAAQAGISIGSNSASALYSLALGGATSSSHVASLTFGYVSLSEADGDIVFCGYGSTTKQLRVGGFTGAFSRDQFRLETSWLDATDASRTSRSQLFVVGNAVKQEFMRADGNAGGAVKIGFNGSAAIVKPTITGSRGGNAALASLLTELANYGLITDGTSA